MECQYPPRASPREEMSIAQQAMQDAVDYGMAHGGPSVARQRVEHLLNGLSGAYPDLVEAYDTALVRIAEYERQERLLAEERQQQRLLDALMTLAGSIGTVQVHSAVQPAPEPEVAEPVELPPALATDEAMALWRLVQAEGYVDKNYQPVGLSLTQMAYLAHTMAEKLGITNMWALFEPLWHRKYMGSAYGRSIDQDQTKAFRLKLNQLFSDDSLKR